MTDMSDQFGPIYDITSATLGKFRFLARKGLRNLTKDERRAYGAAVEQAVLAKQRSQLKGYSEPQHVPFCASGTFYSAGEDIDAAVKQKQRAALARCPSQERRSRSDRDWQAMYANAMAERRKRCPANTTTTRSKTAKRR